MMGLAWIRRVVPSLLLVGMVVPAVVAAQGVEAPRRPLTTSIDELNALRSAYVDEFNNKNASAVSNMYAPDAVVVEGNGSMMVGSAAIAKSMADSAAGWPHAVIQSDTLRVWGNWAVDVGTWTLHPKSGGALVARYTSVLHREMNGWVIESVAVVPMPSSAPAKR